MSGSGGADEIYGACLTFFIRSDYTHAIDSSVGVSLSNDSAGSEFIAENEEHDWWEAACSPEPDRQDKVVWSGVCVSVLTRGPFLEQLCRALLYMYLTEILEPLNDWEQEVSIKYQLGDIKEAKPLVLGCTSMLVGLCLECPLPLSGYYSIRVNFPESYLSHELVSKAIVSIYPEQHPDSQFIEDIQSNGIFLYSSTSEQLPDVQFDVSHFFRLLGPRVALDCIAFALAECKVLYHSRNVAKLPIICESIRALIYPFKWSHVFVPVIPAVLLDLVQAPVPFILGVQTSRLQFIPYDFLKDVIIVNCDTGSIDRSRLSSKLVSFPSDIDRWLMLASKMILYPPISSEDLAPLPVTANEIFDAVSVPVSRQLQVLLFDVMMGVLRHVPSCLFFVNKRTPVFNRPLFMSMFSSSESLAFLDVITNSNSFHQFIAGINSNTLQLFLKCSEVDPVFFYGKSTLNTPLSSSPPSRKASMGFLQKDMSSPNVSQHLGSQVSLSSVGAITRRRSSKVDVDRIDSLPAWIIGDNWSHDLSSLRNIFQHRLKMYLYLNDQVQNDLLVGGVVTKQVPSLMFKIESKSAVSPLSASIPGDDDALLRPPSIRLSVSKPAGRTSGKLQYGIQGSINRRESIKESLSKSRSHEAYRRASGSRRSSYDRSNSQSNPMRTLSNDSAAESTKSGDDLPLSEMQDETPVLCIPLPPVTLDTLELISASHEMKTWTVRDISERLHMPEEVIANQLASSAVARYSSLASVASRAQTAFNFGLDSSNSQLDDRVVFFLQQAFSADTAFEKDIDTALFGCAAALHDAKQRLALVEILSQSESNIENKQGKTALKLFPVHETLFNALHRLSNTLVQCCASQDDFLAAYKLLQVGGKYCCVVSSPENAEISFENDDNTQFLSDLIRHQPIYQNTSLWAAVMQSRLPLGTESTDVLMNEVHSLLHEMHGIGVNFDRALLFIQSIADDYRMDVEKYFDLQRFMANIWISEDDAAEGADHAEHTKDFEQMGHPRVNEGEYSADSHDSYPSRPMESFDEEDLAPRANSRRRSSFFKVEEPADSLERNNSVEAQGPVQEADNGDPRMDPTTNRRRRSIFEVSPEDLLQENPPSPPTLSRAASIDKPRPLMPKSNSPLLAAGRKTLEKQEQEKPSALREHVSSLRGTSDFGLVRNLSVQSDASSTSQSQSLQPRSTSPSRVVLESFSEDAEEEEGLDLTFEHSSDLLSFAKGLSRDSLSSPRRSYFSSFFSNLSSSVLTQSAPKDSPKIPQNKSPARSPVSSLTRGTVNAIKAKRSESEAVNIPSVGKAIAEVYEELLLLDKTGKVRKGGTVTALHSSSNWLVTGSDGGIVELIDMKLGQQVAAVTHKEPIAAVRCLDNASGFVSACRGGVVKVWKMPRPTSVEASVPTAPAPRKSWFSLSSTPSVSPQDKRIAVIKGHANPITALASEGGFDDGDSAYWQIATGDTTGEVSVYRGSAKGLEFNSAELRKEGKSKRAKLINVGGVSCLAMMTSGKLSKLRRTGVEYSPASDIVAVGSKNGAFALLDINTGHWTFRQSDAHVGKVNCIDPLSGREVFTASNDRTVKLWDVRQRYSYNS